MQAKKRRLIAETPFSVLASFFGFTFSVFHYRCTLMLSSVLGNVVSNYLLFHLSILNYIQAEGFSIKKGTTQMCSAFLKLVREAGLEPARP